MTKPMKSKQKQEKYVFEEITPEYCRRILAEKEQIKQNEQITQNEYDKKAEARRQAILKKKQEEIIRQLPDRDTFWENCFASDREVEHYYNMIGRENFASVGTYRSYNCPFD